MKYYVAVYLKDEGCDQYIFIAEGNEEEIKKQIVDSVSYPEYVYEWEVVGSKDTPDDLVKRLLSWLPTWLGEEEEY